MSPKFHVYDQPDILDYAGCTDVNNLSGRNRIIGQGTVDNGQYNIPQETSSCHGGGMMTTRDIVDKVGMIPEPYFLYYEEVEWCEIIKEAGYKVFYQPKALIRHRVSGTIGLDSTLKTYYLTRNRILFMRRNKPYYAQFIFFVFFFLFSVPKNTMAFMLKNNSKHIRYFYLALIWNIDVKTNPKF